MPNHFLTNCFGKQKLETSLEPGVTEVKILKDHQGNFLLRPFEESLQEAENSKSITALEEAIGNAKQSGLFVDSKEFFQYQESLKIWKNAANDVTLSCEKVNMNELSAALDKVTELELADEKCEFEYAKDVLGLLQAKNKLRDESVEAKVPTLEGCLKEYCRAEKKLEAFKEQKNFNSTLLSNDEKKKAEDILKSLRKEEILFQEHPEFPEEELHNALEKRDLSMLKTAMKRWERFELSHESQLYQSALNVTKQLTQQRKIVALQGMEESLKRKDSARLRTYLTYAKEAEVDACLVDVYENLALPALKDGYDIAKHISFLLSERDSYKLSDLISATIETTSLYNCEDMLTCQNFHNYEESQEQEIDQYFQILNKVKTQINSIVSESRNVFKVAQCVANSFIAKEQSISAMNNIVDGVLAILSSFANEYCGGARYTGSQFPFQRRSLLQSPKDRLVLSREIINSMSHFPEKLSASTSCSRLSLNTFEHSLKQAQEVGVEWSKSHHLDYEPALEVKANYSEVDDAENVTGIIERLLEVAKAENSLTFFESSSSIPADPTEIENIMVHIKEGLKMLDESGVADVDSQHKYTDLCYNRVGNEKYRTKKDQFQNTSLALNYFSTLFPEQIIAATKKAAEIQLVELKLLCADEEDRIRSAKFALKQAVEAKHERRLTKALHQISLSEYADDGSVNEAEKELKIIRDEKSSCRDSLRAAAEKNDEVELKETLLQADLCLSPTDEVLVFAKRNLDEIQFFKSRQQEALTDLQKAATLKNLKEIRFVLARAKACRVPQNNPTLMKAQQNLQRLRSSRLSKSKEDKFCDDLKKKLNVKPVHDSINFNKLNIAKSPLSSRDIVQEGKRYDATNDRLIKCLKIQLVQVFNADIASESSSDHLRILLQYAEQEDVELPEDLVEASRKALTVLSQRRSKAEALKVKLKQSLESNSFQKLAAAIASAESESEIFDCQATESSDELLELTMQAKEQFALLNMHRKTEEKEKSSQQISLARRKLKKAMLQDANGSPLKEAVETFRLVCSSVSPRVLSRVDKEKQKEGGGIQHNPFSFGSTFGRRKSANKKKTFLLNQQERFADLTKKLYRAESPGKNAAFRQTSNKLDIIRTRTNTQMAHPLKSQRNLSKRSQINKKRLLSSSALEGKNSSVLQKSLKHLDGGFQKKPDISTTTLKARPLSAVERGLDKEVEVPSVKIAWEEMEEKNIALLRRAEKNLKKLEKQEEKRKEDEENKEFLSNIKDVLLTNLHSSIQSKDRAELWQAVHEFRRYFGEESRDELFVRAKEALRASTFLQYKDNLRKAVTERNQEKLDHVIYEIEHESTDYFPINQTEKKEFLNEISKAKKLATHLGNLQHYRESVLAATRSDISEMNSYASPPEVIKSVMAATYLLLGETETTVKKWKNLHALIGKLGQQSLTRRVLRCLPESISASACQTASAYLKELTHERVRAISVGASIFFAWTKCMIFEVISRRGANQSDKRNSQNLGISQKQPVSSRKMSPEVWQRLTKSTRPITPKHVQENFKMSFNLAPRRPMSART